MKKQYLKEAIKAVLLSEDYLNEGPATLDEEPNLKDLYQHCVKKENLLITTPASDFVDRVTEVIKEVKKTKKDTGFEINIKTNTGWKATFYIVSYYTQRHCPANPHFNTKERTEELIVTYLLDKQFRDVRYTLHNFDRNFIGTSASDLLDPIYAVTFKHYRPGR